ncbi:DNA mismatch repair protein MutS [Pedobacter sp. Du54]|uniref:MutS-related protein n=1 Tax=Pedobacter anseongensis TaxID=3133439 RepID=UPI0030A4D18E
MFKTQQEILTKYESLLSDTKINITAVKAKIDRFSFIRVALLIVEIALFIGFVSSDSDTITFILGISLAIPIAVFVVVVKNQNVLSKHETYLKNLLWIYQNEILVINGKENGYSNGGDFADNNHPYESDLDIFGNSSLYELINRCTTKRGLEELARHLSKEMDKHTILDRQAAVKEILTEIDTTFKFRANLKGHNVSKIEELKYKLKEQLAKQLLFTQNKLLRMYVKLLPILTISLLVLAVLFGGKLWGFLSLVALIHASIMYYYTKWINAVYYGFSGSALVLNDYAEAIGWTEAKAWESPYIKNLFESSDKVSEEIKKLAKIIQAFDARLNILLGALLNFFFLWDLRCCIKIDQWHKAAASKVENGLDRIGSFEELIAISTLTHNHPNWTFPVIEDDFFFSAQALGHPLIPSIKRVDNNFDVSASPTVDIITGSNMAGKSTFLRTVGINMVLAYLGAPVCAERMQLSIFKLLTYMRIKDSLNENTSTFKAELNRLKMILTQVALHENAFVLIDEMLRGTNSRDKFMGSKVFIERLIYLKTSTLFATHDLQLSELKDLYDRSIRNFHFDIQINQGEMEFDYKLKGGPCTIFNAAILLKEIGLSLE